MMTDKTNTQKSLYRGKGIGKNVGKAVSEKTAKLDSIKTPLCKSIYLMLDDGETVKSIIKRFTGEHQVEGLTEDQTIRLVYDCESGRISKKFTRERLGL